MRKHMPGSETLIRTLLFSHKGKSPWSSYISRTSGMYVHEDEAVFAVSETEQTVVE